MQNFVGVRLQRFNTPGAMGLVNGARYIKCFWPVLDRPVMLFAPGSSGIEVMGPPTPRNVVFPPDTVFLERNAEADFAAERAALGGRKMINLNEADVISYMSAYAAKAIEFAGASKLPTRADCFSVSEGKAIYEITPKQKDDLLDGTASFRDILAAAKVL